MRDRILTEIKEWVISIAIAAVIAFAIKGFIFDIVQVSGPSMIPTLHDNDRVAIEKISLYTKSFKRGEIIILDPGEKGRGLYIKRLIALPGDRLQIKSGSVFINGEKVNEPYLSEGTETYAEENIDMIIPEGFVYVLGDNREVSEDSRYIGPIPFDHIKGHAIFKVFPFSDMKKL
ncbi:Signal peptidase I P [Caloramator mitchellensis]|uniref:Signal peptidase I n=1 Tax=Caloramator mitchellensis TaxID=908809 RepID=A0A0R3JRL5_CALMK|nr:signal peptidase I [Caloramator mitchellensis]KRQ86089.1 Signal peptidase I P [Caloramator mitchellensis]